VININNTTKTTIMLPFSFALIYMKFVEYIKYMFNAFRDNIIKYNGNRKQNELIYFDFETTGLNPYHDKIIEYAFMIEDDSENTYISELVNPETKIEKKITDITGIHPDMLENKKNINEHITPIYNFISGVYNPSCLYNDKKFLVAHNAITFDKIFLMRELNTHYCSVFPTKNKPYLDNIMFIDSLLLARKIIPGLYSYSLRALSKHFNVSSGTHRALDDVFALKNIFDRLLIILSGNLNISVDYLKENPQIIIDYIEC
jgi:DNA polymerase III alpha subunit (gram-positive type)